MKTITCFEIVDHGIDNSQYFRGCGVSSTKYTNVATGCGDNPSEALNDALEQLANGDWDTQKVTNSEDARPFLNADKPSASAEIRDQLKADNPQGKNETDDDYSERIDGYASETDSELHYYLSVRVSDKTDWDETPEGFVDYALPSCWASYLINGDASGIDENEKAECDAFLALDKLGNGNCVDCSEESFFAFPENGGMRGDCLNYRFRIV
jgi:hypothetical protein